MCACVCVCIHLCIYVYIDVGMCVHVCMYVCTCEYIVVCVHLYVCVRVCAFVLSIFVSVLCIQGLPLYLEEGMIVCSKHKIITEFTSIKLKQPIADWISCR